MKEYLGDGVYVIKHQFGITLTTDDDLADTNIIEMKPKVVKAFQIWLDRNFEARS